MVAPQVTEATIVAGALVAQILLVVILFVGAAIIRGRSYSTGWYRGHPGYSGFAWELLALLLLSLGLLAFSTTFSSSWLPLLGHTSATGFPPGFALSITFLADILVVSRLVYATGGSINSPFQPTFFLIPTLAILLREPTYWVVAYTCLVALLFWLLLPPYRERHPDHEKRIRIAYGVVSIASLFLAMLVGLLTRPASGVSS